MRMVHLPSTLGMLRCQRCRDEERLGDPVARCVEKTGKKGEEGEPADLKLITSKMCWGEDFHSL